MRLHIRQLLFILFLLYHSERSFAQAPPAVLMPVPRQQFFSASGVPLAGGCLFSYISGTSTPLATFTDSTGSSMNTNPVILDAGGEASVWLGPQTYRLKLVSSGGINCAAGSQQWQIDGISDVGQLLYNAAVLLSPLGGAQQTITGPLAATRFVQTVPHVTSVGVRVSVLDPSTSLDTASNPPNMVTVQPAAPGQTYRIPDPLGHATYVMNPDPTQAGLNQLDCTQTGLTCKRTASFYFGGGSCSGTTPTLGWDTFATNNPLAFCLTGTNTQKAVMGLPSAYAHLQQNTGTNSASTTITTTYPNTLLGGNGDMLVLSIAFNGTTTITGCTDTTNAYAQAKHVANGALSLDVWVFHNATTKPAGTTLTCTFAGAATGALKWHEYVAPNATSTDVSASITGTSTACGTGTTASTAQATELAFAACGTLSVPTMVVVTPGYADHGVLVNGSTVEVDDAGIIMQTIGTATTQFNVGSSQALAGAVVTFKAANGGPAVAQKTVLLPAFFNSAQAINAVAEWSNPLIAAGTSNAVFGAALVCSPGGATDDPAFNIATTVNSPAGQSAANTLTQVSLSALNATGCAAGNILHYQLSRQRYNANDIFEGFANVYGSNLQIGITQ